MCHRTKTMQSSPSSTTMTLAGRQMSANCKLITKTTASTARKTESSSCLLKQMNKSNSKRKPTNRKRSSERTPQSSRVHCKLPSLGARSTRTPMTFQTVRYQSLMISLISKASTLRTQLGTKEPADHATLSLSLRSLSQDSSLSMVKKFQSSPHSTSCNVTT